MRNTIFISYSHKDHEWLERFEAALKIGVVRGVYDTWSDKQIGASEEWREKIEARISAARIALLLVTPDFLRSEYISNMELKTILDRQKIKGLIVFWVLIKFVPKPYLQLAGLVDIQAAYSTERPLAELPPGDCQRAIDSICAQLIQRLGLPGNANTQAIERLENELKAALGPNFLLGERIQFGEFSIVYKANQKRKEVAIKMVMPSMRRGWIATDFIARAERFQDIESPFIRVLGTISEGRINCVMMEYVAFPTLQNVIDRSGALQPADVADVLSQVTLAAENLQKLRAKTEEPKSTRQYSLLIGT